MSTKGAPYTVAPGSETSPEPSSSSGEPITLPPMADARPIAPLVPTVPSSKVQPVEEDGTKVSPPETEKELDSKLEDKKHKKKKKHEEEPKKKKPGLVRDNVVSKLCSSIVDHPLFQVTAGIALMIALFATDVWELCSVPNDSDDVLDGILCVILGIFAGEIILNVIAKIKYPGSFFFWMDILGTLSMLADIRWISEPLMSGLGFNPSEGSTLRASRAARVGSRAGRLTRLARLVRLVRLLRLFRVFRMVKIFEYFGKRGSAEEPEEEISASMKKPSEIANKLADHISKVIAMCIMVCVVALPNLGTVLEDSSMTALFSTFSSLSYAETQGTITEACVDELLPTYVDAFYNFYELGPQGTHALELIYHNKTFPPPVEREPPKRKSNEMRIVFTDEVDTDLILVEARFDRGRYKREESMFNILLIVFVLSMLLFFSTSLNANVTAMVVTPLERIMNSLDSKNLQGMDMGDGAVGDGDEDSTKAYENMVNRMVRIVKSAGTGLSSQAGKSHLEEMKKFHMDADFETYVGTEYSSIILKRKSRKMKMRNLRRTSLLDKSESSDPSPNADQAPDTALTDVSNLQGDPKLEPPLIWLDHEHGIVDRALLHSWDFDVQKLDSKQSHAYLLAIMDELSILAECKIDPRKFVKFTQAVEALYLPNPYHNWQHACDVTHTIFRMLTLVDTVSSQMDHLEKFALIIAAICHDVQHPGVSNAFLVTKKDELAMVYNDMSVLENRHASVLYSVVKDDECNVFEGLTEDEWKACRKLIISCILKTDMSHHFEMINKVGVYIDMKGDTIGEYIQLDSDDDRLFMYSILLHSADISHVCKPWDRHLRWSNAVSEEFYRQGDLEKQLGMKVSPMCDRGTLLMSKSQIGFIEFVASPLFAHVVKLFPQLIEMMQILVMNRRAWIEMLILDVQNKDPLAQEDDLLKAQDRTETFEGKMMPPEDLEALEIMWKLKQSSGQRATGSSYNQRFAPMTPEDAEAAHASGKKAGPRASRITGFVLFGATDDLDDGDGNRDKDDDLDENYETEDVDSAEEEEVKKEIKKRDQVRRSSQKGPGGPQIAIVEEK